MTTKTNRYMISVDDQMYTEIEDYRFLNRYNTRSEATKALIRIGLEEVKSDPSKVERMLIEWGYLDDLQSNKAAAHRRLNTYGKNLLREREKVQLHNKE